MSDLPTDTVKDHYELARPVYEVLARVGENPTIGNNDFVGWYIKRDTDDADAIEAGYPQRGRVAQLDRDLDELLDRLDRTLYAITSYKRPEAFERWVHCTFEDDQTHWQGEKPTPGLEDLRAVPAWGDIDLADDLKADRGSLDADTRSTIEDALAAYADEYADLYGDRGAVFALDSVGGAYIFGAPAATLPIADHFADDEPAIGRVMDAFIDRTNEWLEAAEDRVNERVEGAADVLDPDWVNNLNRQYKAPLSIHSKHDAVVTPLDIDAPDYTATPLEDVDDDLVSAAVEWAESLTSEAHTDCVDDLVATLWPDEYEAEGSWEGALDAWVEEQRRLEEEQQRQRREALLARERRRDEGIEGLPITPHIQDVLDAIDRLDIESVADKTIVHQWTDQASGKRDTSGEGKRAFVPIWGPNAAGTANYVDTQQGIWVDTGQNHHGTAVEMALIAAGGWTRGDIADGSDWARGVDELRKRGFEIPVWTPDAGTPRRDGGEYDQMPYWALRRAAIALGVIDRDDLEEREGDDGDPYLAIPGDRFDAVLEAIEDAGLEHGRERRARRQFEELSDLLNEYEVQDAEPDGYDRWRIGYLLGQVNADDFVAVYERSADVLESTPAAIERHRALEQHRRSFDTDEPVDIIAEDGKLWHLSGVPLRRGSEPVLNFDWDVQSMLDLPGEDTHIELELTYNGQPIRRTVTMGIFNDHRDFRANIIVKPGMLFRPGEQAYQDALNDLNFYTGAQDAPVLQGTHHMGLHGSEWVVPGGALTPDGWTDDPETVYVEQGIGAERQVSLPLDRDDYDPEAVADILRDLPKTRAVERLLPVIGWFYAAPLRPHIYDMEGEFNLLNVTGDTGSGKTTTLRYLWRCFGMKGEPFSVNDTPFAHTRTMASTNSVPIWYDEYKPGDIENWRITAYHGLIRKAATGGIEQRGNPDKSVDEYVLHAPVVISGEQQIQPPAERRRSIMVTFKSRTTAPGAPTAKAYKRLAGEARIEDKELVIPEDAPDPADHALAYLQYVASLDHDTVKGRWHAARKQVADYRDLWGDSMDLDDLEVQALQTVLFGWESYLDFADRHGVARERLPDDVAVEAALRHVATSVGPGGRRKSHLERFIELISRAASRGSLKEGQEYAIVHEGTESEELRFHIDKTYDAVSKYVRDHGLDGEDLFDNARDYRKRIRERYEDEDDETFVSYTQKTPPVGKCAGLMVAEAERELNFDRSAFVPVEDEPDEALEAAIPLSRLRDERGYQTVTAKVLTLEDDTPPGAPDVSGTLTDRTATVDFVAWSRLADLDHDISEDGTYLFENARVGEYQGAIQVELIADVTSIEEIGDGVGYTGLVGEGDEDESGVAANGGRQSNLRGLDADDDEAHESDAAYESEPDDESEPEPEPDTTTDGNDIIDARGQVREYLRVHTEAGDYVSVSGIAGALKISPAAAQHALEKLALAGDLIRENDETFEVV